MNLVGTYTTDFSLYEPEVVERGLGPQDWGNFPKPDELTIKWHTPSEEELDFALEILRSQGQAAMSTLRTLIDGTLSIKRDGSGKSWSDEVSKNLVLMRLLLAGASVLFDSKALQAPEGDGETHENGDVNMKHVNGGPKEVSQEEDEEALASDDNEIRPSFKYTDGYPLQAGNEVYEAVHAVRTEMGHMLHDVHVFLCENQEDDVAAFNPLYTAYKSWFVDVGIEKSAHVLDRVTRLFAADIHPYKMSGLRKEYPRPLLVRRANVYHLQRLRHNASPRKPTELEKQLLLDLAQSSVSGYTEVRRNAQNAIESASKVIIGARALLISPVLSAFEAGIKELDYGRIKGGLYTLLFGSLAKTISRDWRYTPRMVWAYLEACEVDRSSVQKLCSLATIQIMEFGRSGERMAVLDEAIIQSIAPDDAEVEEIVSSKRSLVKRNRATMESKKAALTDQLVDMTRKAHWKTASRTAAIVVTLGFRFETLASDNLIDLLTKGTIDTHPGLRGLYSGALVALFSLLSTRITSEHSYENYVTDKQKMLGKIEVATRRDDLKWTEEHLASFARADTAFYVDHEYPGWLVWGSKMPAYKADIRAGH